MDRNEVEQSGQQADLLWGVKAISEVLERTERQTFHMLSKGYVPGRKIGRLWVASRSKLIAAVSEPARVTKIEGGFV